MISVLGKNRVKLSAIIVMLIWGMYLMMAPRLILSATELILHP
jgi:hypothetical protein